MAARQERKFTDEEAQRFAALMAGFDTGNPSEAEAMSKGRVLRRMVADRGIRLVDALEFEKIRTAIDRQSQPVRATQTVKVVKEVKVFEVAELKAPFGMDHPSFIWWTPARPSMAIDNMGLSDIHRSEHRDSAAIRLEWNRIDFYLESELPVGALVYVGRAAPQQETVLYGGKRYGGGGIQFRLTQPPEVAFHWMRRYVAA